MYGLDLFSGIGGLTRALEGYVTPVAYCECDKYARSVLLSRMASGDIPYAPIWDDVRTLTGESLPSNIDILYGGFPCQDISVAGTRYGLEGKRSSLFFEIIRLANETHPKFIFLENSSNIRTKGLGRVLKEFDRIGYDCRWGILSASDIGAPHKRERWFLLAHARRESDTQKDQAVSSFGVKEIAWNYDRRSDGTPLPRNDWWLHQPRVDRMVNGVSKRVERGTALGNAVVPQQARYAFEVLSGLRSQ